MLVFLCFTVAGTLLHEGGHWLAARAFGYKPHLGYGYTRFGASRHIAEMDRIETTYKNEIRNKLWFKEEARYTQVLNEYWYEQKVITAAGPLQTVLSGTLGFILLYRRRHKIRSGDIAPIDWLLVFLSLFWLRQPFNFTDGFIHFLYSGRVPGSCDEVRLAGYFGINAWLLLSITALMGAAVLAWVLFYLLPLRLRLTFMAAGLVGGLSGAWLWLVHYGPLFMP